MTRRATLLLGFAAASALCGAASAQPSASVPSSVGPAFSCANPSKIEAVICGSADLAGRDRTMAALYAAAKQGALGNGRSSQLAAQRAWLKERDKDCAATPTVDCLANQYDARLQGLAVAALFIAPDAALNELRREDAPSAAVYEAIYRYATVSGGADRTHAVAPLIGPVFAKEVQDGGMPPDAKTPEAALASDKAFAQVLDLASPQLDKSLTLPCAAIVKRPGLIATLEPIFGSSMDAQLTQADCDDTLAPTPKLDALDDAANSTAPTCEGTMHFASDRTWEQMLTAVRLNRPDVWRDIAKHMGKADRPETHFRTGYKADIAGATSEVATNYTADYGLATAAAQTLAAEAVSDLVAGSFRLCDN